MSGGWVRAFAPASVSNVGPGFDVLGFAVDGPGDTVAARRRPRRGDEPPVTLVAVEGDGGRLPRDAARNTAGVAATAVLRAVNDPGVALELRLVKGMPLASGLGSSAASAVAAAVAADAALGAGLDRETLLGCAAEGERVACGAAHLDNVGPSLWGGFVLVRPGATPPVVPLPVPAGLACALVRPHVEVETGAARALLGDTVSLAAAVTQWGNLAALVAALHQGDLELLASALVDVVAEPLRAPLVPGFAAVQEAARAAGALGCSLSGSGPSIFALCRDRAGAEAAVTAMRLSLADAGVAGDALVSAVGAAGARVLAEDIGGR